MIQWLRALAVVACAMFIGAMLALRLHGQPLSQLQISTAKLEVGAALLESRVSTLEKNQMHTDSELATIEGIGIGLGSTLGLLQMIQMVLGRGSRVR